MSEPKSDDRSRDPIVLDEAPGKRFFIESIEFTRTPEAQSLPVEIEYSGGKTVVTLTTENTEDLEKLVLEYMEKAKAIDQGVDLNYAEIVWDSDRDLVLVLCITLPHQVGILSDEGFKLQELAQSMSETNGNPMSIEFFEYQRGNVLPLKIPKNFQSSTFEYHQKVMWARMAADGFKEAVRNQHFERRVREPHKRPDVSKAAILRQVVWKIDSPKTREYSAIVLITIMTYVACLILCTWIESLKH
jgi:hypothetical protein